MGRRHKCSADTVLGRYEQPGIVDSEDQQSLSTQLDRPSREETNQESKRQRTPGHSLKKYRIGSMFMLLDQ